MRPGVTNGSLKSEVMATYFAFLRLSDDETYTVKFPDLPGCVTIGENLALVCAQAGENLARHLTRRHRNALRHSH